MKKIILSSVLIISLAQILFAQTIVKDKKDDISPELKKEAVAFLRETTIDVNNLRTLENRISFASETANLMWFSDEKEARAMFQTVINDFRQLLTQYDAQAIAAGAAVDTDEGFSFTGGSGKSDVLRKFFKASNVRQQIATSLAENDAQLAFDFLNDTTQIVTFPAFRKQLEQTDVYFQRRLLSQITAQNVDVALKYGRKSLAKGFGYEQINLLKKIYAKDQEKGAAFGEDVLQKLKSSGVTPESSFYFTMVLNLGVENLKKTKGISGKTPMFSEQSLRGLAEIVAQEMLKRKTTTEYNGIDTLNLIEQVLPERAAQIRQIASSKSSNRSSLSPPTAMTLNAQLKQNAEKQLMESVPNLGAKQLSKEERQKVVGQARKIIAGVKEPTAKLFALSALAAQIAAVDKELAVEIMDDAKKSVNLQPKNYLEFMQLWLLAGGYAQVDADRAFPILEDAIFRLNDTISSFVKVGEFMDTSNEIIEDGEVQVGSFGGGMARQLLSGLGATDATIRSLAKADFARTKALTNKFDRPEARILAKMLVLRGIFGEKKEAAGEE